MNSAKSLFSMHGMCICNAFYIDNFINTNVLYTKEKWGVLRHFVIELIDENMLL